MIEDIWQAQKDSIFSRNVFNSNVKHEQIDGDSAILEIELQRNQTGSPEDGAMIVVASPPMFLNFLKNGGAWKYSGVNQEMTMEAMKNFKPELPRSKPRSDF